MKVFRRSIAWLSNLLSTFAVLPCLDARLASSRWSTLLDGLTVQGSYRRFQSCSLHLILLSKLVAAITSTSVWRIVSTDRAGPSARRRRGR